MDDLVTFFVGFGLGLFVAILIIASGPVSEDGKEALNLRAACEADLPRNQECEMFYKPALEDKQ